MALDELTDGLKEYFKDRPEYVPGLKEIEEHREIRRRVFEYHLLLHNSNPSAKVPRIGDISPEKMYGNPDNNFRLIQDHVGNLRDLASVFYGFPQKDIGVDDSKIMIYGRTKPIRADIFIQQKQDDVVLNKRFYIKEFDVTRIVGLELYRILSGYKETPFIFSEDLIIEDNIEGEHLFNVSDRVGVEMDPNYVRSKIRNKLVASFMRLGDIEKEDNYLVTSDRMMKFIDFDDFKPAFGSGSLRMLDQEHNQMLDEEKMFLAERAYASKEKLEKLSNVMVSIENPDVKSAGFHIYAMMRYLNIS